MARPTDVVLVIDVESTCWQGEPPEGQTSEIIEIGVCTLHVASAQPLGKRSILVKPQTSTVSPFCEQLTTISQAMLDEQGVTLVEAFRILKNEYASKSRIWYSWGDYDRRQFERECAAKQLSYPLGATHLNAKTLFALQHALPHEIGMAEALERCSMKLDGTHHRGHDDAWNIARLIGKLWYTAREDRSSASFF